MTTSNFRERTRAAIALSLLAAGAAVACSPLGGGGDHVGRVQIAITDVPADVHCLRITAAGDTRTVVVVHDVSPAQSAVFALNGLPVGVVTFTGEAFGGSCAAVNDTTIPDWISDPVEAAISSGQVTPVALRLHRNGRASVSVGFDDSGPADGGTTPDGGNDGSVPAPDGGPVDARPPQTGSVAYVTDQGCLGAINVVDLSQNAVVGQIPLPQNQNGISTSFEVAFAPDGATAYVSGVVPKGGDPDATPGELFVIDTTARSLARTIELPGAPWGVAVSPDGRRVFVSNELRPVDLHEVAAIDTATGAVLAHIPVGHAPRGVTVSPDGSRVYVANAFDHSLSVVDTASSAVIADIGLTLDEPLSVVVSPDGTRAYVSGDQGPGAGTSAVLIVDLASNAQMDAVALPGAGQQIAISPDGARVYVTYSTADPSGTLTVGHVAVIDTGARAVLADVLVGSLPLGLAVTPGGERLYVANVFSDTLSVVDTGAATVVTTIQGTQLCPYGIAIK
jgi:YVTN family beta-propeller protein